MFDCDAVQPLLIVEHEDQCIYYLAQVVRRHVGSHTDGDAAGAVDEQVGQGGGQNVRLLQRVVEVVVPVDGVLFQVGQHQAADLGEPGLGIAHGRRVVSVQTAEIALPVNQRVAQAEGLRHTHHGVVDRGVAVGVVFAEHFTHDTGALLVRLGVVQPQVMVYGIEDAPVYGLEPVAHIRQRTADDHAHGVIEVRALHLFYNVGLAHKAIVAVGSVHNTSLM